jgi:16S rRNA (cytidine1402-2'-O)-methyltransferase
MVDVLRLLAEAEPDAQVAACREMTKRHEEVIVGTPAEVAGRLSAPRGEYTLVISGLAQEVVPATPKDNLDVERLVRKAREAGVRDRTIVELLRAAGVPRREAYGLVWPSEVSSSDSPGAR